ncbi:MAG: Uma2 family endonuclease [Myxococcaceae bacterium]
MRASLHRYTWIQYLALEESSTVKHEFFEGEIYAMAGGTPAHSALSLAVGSELRAQLKGKPCRAYNSDLRIRVAATGLGTYPDVSVVCGDLEHDSERLRGAVAVTNPTLIVEVSSASTESYDRGTKFDNYRQIPSLREYVIVSHRERLIEVFRREEQDWIRTEAHVGGAISLESIDCVLTVAAIYEGIELEQ